MFGLRRPKATTLGRDVAGPVTAVGAQITRLWIFAAKRDFEDLALLAGMAERGEITPVVERTYPLSEAADARWQLEREHARGKIVLSL